ncbi:hypothetical protein RP726_05650 [Candidatus Methylospira mobilis]|uniref:hypothetical protein n=1 Tax=Candidatus Methylospira mobilis TaxID=1808979 RepID=UPI0028E68FDF|nr:hypothetical protein [Candidatus Methylospira mobilis]WNV05896.1 hypothetical protein RP726_05650 [Candidatus Methylospira mobilis]
MKGFCVRNTIYLITMIIIMIGMSSVYTFPAIWTEAELFKYLGMQPSDLGVLGISSFIAFIFVAPYVPLNKPIYIFGTTLLNVIMALLLVAGAGLIGIYYGIPAYMHGREQKDVAALEQREGADPKAAALHWLAKVESKYDLLDDDIKRDQTDLCFSERVWNASYQEAFNQHWAWWVPSHHLMHPKGETTIELDSNPYFDYVEKKRKLLNQLYPKPNHQSIKERGVCFNGRHTVQTKANLVQFGNRPNEGKGFRVKNDQSLFSVDSVTASALDMEFAKNSH